MADGTSTHAATDAKIAAELTTAQGAVGLTGDRYTYHLFYAKNQAVCSSSVGGCYFASPFKFCAYHGFQTISGHNNIFSVRALATDRRMQCADEHSSERQLLQTLSHELTESLTDPYLDAWYNSERRRDRRHLSQRLW